MNSETRIYPGASRELPFILEQLGAGRVFLVRGRQSFEASGAKTLVDELLTRFSLTHFYDFSPNPDIADVKKGVAAFKDSACSCILAIGGGSVMDMAKLISYYREVDMQHFSFKWGGLIYCFEPQPLVCLPTTAGSGTEATHFAVVYEGLQKYSIADARLLPHFVLIDPELQQSQSAYQKAASGMDAFAQALESMWNVNATPHSMQLAESALRLLWTHLEEVVWSRPNASYWAVATAANLAGRAINITKTTAPHALSYGFTKTKGLPHGHAVGLSLPFFIDYHRSAPDERCNDVRGAVFVQAVLQRVAAVLNCSTDSLSETVALFAEALGLELNFRALDISRENFDAAVANVNVERLKNNPFEVDAGVLDDFFQFNNR